MPQKDVELILMRQCASYLAMPIFLLGADENLLYYNQPAEAILGRPFEEVEVGEMTLDTLSSMFQTTAEDGTPLETDELPLADALRKRRPSHRRFRYRALDGRWRTVEVTAIPVEGQAGQHLGAMAIFWEADDR